MIPRQSLQARSFRPSCFDLRINLPCSGNLTEVHLNALMNLISCYREAEIDRNFATMNREIKLWKERVESKNKHAQQEKEKREKVLAMVSSKLSACTP